MVEPAKTYQDQLKRLKKDVESSESESKENCENYHKWRYFVFKTAIDERAKAKLDVLGKADTEFNIIEAYLSRLRGEFSKQKPSILVSSNDESTPNEKLINAVQGYMLAVLSEANNNQFEYDVYSDLLGGGFSVIKVLTDYANEMTFDQDIKLARVYEPTMCGFDPMARLPHKGDGRFCYEYFPMSKDDFKKQYPNVDIKQLKFNESGDFRWCYKTDGKEEVIIVCDYYEKIKKRKKIVLLSDGRTITKKDYDAYIEEWAQSGAIAQPAIVIDERETEIQTICRYRFISNKVIEYKETKFNQFPLIFVDGNSVYLKQGAGSPIKQFTRSYFYNAIGIQKLKNVCGQTLGSEIENLSQVKLNVAKEALPENEEYLKAYTQPQKPGVRVYNAFLKGNPNTPIPAPMDVPRQPIPPEIMNTFMASDQTMQNILGSYDASLGINDNQLSGIAIIEAATQSNAAAMPYYVGFLQGLNQAAQIIIDLIPKVHVFPRSLPVVDENNKKDHIKINQKLPNGEYDPNSIRFDYGANSLAVKVEAGANFAIQKSKALQQMGVMMGASQTYAEFINSMGLKVLIQNMEIHAKDQLEVKADEFMALRQEQQKMQMEMQQLQMLQMRKQMESAQSAPNPAVQRNQIEAVKLQHQVQQDAVKNQLAASQQAIDMTKAENDRQKNLLEAIGDHEEKAIRLAQMQTEKAAKEVDLAIAIAHENHQQHSDGRTHAREDARLNHEIIQANKPEPKEDINAGA